MLSRCLRTIAPVSDSALAMTAGIADVLMRKYQLPFRVGHHFASEVIDYAEVERMLKEANAKIVEQDAWIEARRKKINTSLAKRDADFTTLQKSGK